MANDKSGGGAHYTVQQVAEMTGIAASTIRYYDQQFEEYLALERGAGRRRLFDDQAVVRLEKVRELLKDKGLSVRQARRSLGGDPEMNNDYERMAAMEKRVASLEEQMRELRSIQARTLALVESLR